MARRAAPARLSRTRDASAPRGARRRRVRFIVDARARSARQWPVTRRAGRVDASTTPHAARRGGGGFLPDSEPSRPPQTQRRQGPRPVKKRFNGDVALDPRSLKDKRRDDEGQRLSKALAALGVASRRASEELIFAGRVQVNGVTVTVPQHAVSTSRDVIAVDGKVVEGGLSSLGDAGHLYFLLHKPKGYLCSSKPAGAGARARDQDRLVLDLFEDWRVMEEETPGEASPRLFTVGRLDVNTTGMLLVTTDGQWCQRVAHPSSQIPKSYIVTAARAPRRRRSRRWRRDARLTECTSRR